MVAGLINLETLVLPRYNQIFNPEILRLPKLLTIKILSYKHDIDSSHLEEIASLRNIHLASNYRGQYDILRQMRPDINVYVGRELIQYDPYDGAW